jgi:hypothetical protein
MLRKKSTKKGRVKTRPSDYTSYILPVRLPGIALPFHNRYGSFRWRSRSLAWCYSDTLSLFLFTVRTKVVLFYSFTNLQISSSSFVRSFIR